MISRYNVIILYNVRILELSAVCCLCDRNYDGWMNWIKPWLLEGYFWTQSHSKYNFYDGPSLTGCTLVVKGNVHVLIKPTLQELCLLVAFLNGSQSPIGMCTTDRLWWSMAVFYSTGQQGQMHIMQDEASSCLGLGVTKMTGFIVAKRSCDSGRTGPNTCFGG